MAKVRLALTISGAISLGAYEGGALAALLSAVRPLCQGPDPKLRIDAIGGASAGSITGLLAARCLTEGIDPVVVMRQAWVERDSIAVMLRGLEDAPLTVRPVREMAGDLVDPARTPTVDGYQSEPVRLTMLLGCLRGLDYQIKSIISKTDVSATTYVDVGDATVTHGQPVSDFLEPEGSSFLDVALASGANALGFPPRVLDRSAQEPLYTKSGIKNFPATKHLWYTDGGTLDNEPLGHTLDLVGELDAGTGADVQRLHVLIHPHPTAAPTDDGWAAPDNPPTWLATLLRADHLQRSQSLYDDLKRVEKTNSRIAWMERLETAINKATPGLEADQRNGLTGALAETFASIEADRRAFAGSAAAAPEVAPPDDPAVLLRNILERVAGVTGKRKVELEVISPLVLKADKPVDQLLAGEILMHFGGFFDERMRTSDFDLGYTSTLTWLQNDGLGAHGVDDADSATALKTAHDAYTPGTSWEEWGDTSFGSVAARHPFALAGLLAQIARVAGQDVINHHRHAQ